jgi:type I restriction enzyme S subunit
MYNSPDKFLSSLPQGWTLHKLREIAIISSGSTPSRSQQSRYFDNGTIPWVKTGDLNNGVLTCTDERITNAAIEESSCRIYPENTVLVAMYGGYRQIGRTGRLGMRAAINQALSALQVKNGNLLPEYLQAWLNYRVDSWKRYAASSRKDPNITSADVAAFVVALPPIAVQQKIVSILWQWDRTISVVDRLRSCAVIRKNALMQKLFGAKGLGLGFEKQHWKNCVLGDVAFNSTRRVGNSSATPQVYSVTNSVGMVPMPEEVIGESIERYKTVGKFDFAYNPMRINVGSIAMWRGDQDVLVSPDYVVFQCGPDLDAEFLNHFRNTHLWEQFVNRSGGGSVRVRIYFNDLAEMPLLLPPLPEQKKIASILNVQDHEIQLLQRKLNALRRQKKGLMQQLLTGNTRVKISDSAKG